MVLYLLSTYQTDSNNSPLQIKYSLDGVPELEKLITDKYNLYNSKIKEIDPSYNAPTIQKAQFKKTGCFIATATLGDYNHPFVLQLRSFRDEWILQQFWGRFFITKYYRYGKIPANIIAKNEILRKLSCYLLVKPLVYISKFLIKN